MLSKARPGSGQVTGGSGPQTDNAEDTAPYLTQGKRWEFGEFSGF